ESYFEKAKTTRENHSRSKIEEARHREKTTSCQKGQADCFQEAERSLAQESCRQKEEPGCCLGQPKQAGGRKEALDKEATGQGVRAKETTVQAAIS
ncbi:MAG TPA: hypothetical protein VLG74_03935, partial [Blastocatellia bacterium]|nr:hypothetical protein [Blastocatellia bacterium]